MTVSPRGDPQALTAELRTFADAQFLRRTSHGWYCHYLEVSADIHLNVLKDTYDHSCY